MSSTLNATARVHTQAARNVNDGISFLNVADGATSALKDILFRLRELSTQSSNGTFSNAQRQSIDKESQALQAEYGRILETTSYNGIRVFGSGDMVAQAGVGVEAALLVNLSSGARSHDTSKGDGTFQAKLSFATGDGLDSVAVADLQRRRQERPGYRGLTATTPRACCSATATALFRPSSPLPREPSLSQLPCGDLNGDGKSDLVSADYVKQHRERAARQRQRDVSGQAVLRHRNRSLLSRCGRLQRRRQESTWLPRTTASNTASVLLGNGNGTFQAKQSFGTGNQPIGRSL